METARRLAIRVLDDYITDGYERLYRDKGALSLSQKRIRSSQRNILSLAKMIKHREHQRQVLMEGNLL